MGVATSIAKLGLPSVESLSDKIFDKHFKGDICDFENFLIKFLECCSDINGMMLGTHYTAPPIEKIKECFVKWNEAGTEMDKKKLVLNLLKDHVTVARSDNSSLVMAGLVVPPAAMVLKRASQNMPQVNKFRLHLIPDIVFVPTCTVAALFGVKAFQIKSNTS